VDLCVGLESALCFLYVCVFFFLVGLSVSVQLILVCEMTDVSSATLNCSLSYLGSKTFCMT